MSPKVPEDLLAELRRGERFLLTSHIHPDGDALGSAIGLARLLRLLGKSATVWTRDVAPQVYQALPECGQVHTGEVPPEGFPELFDAVIVLECPGLHRTGLEQHFDQLPRLNIDHHLGNELYGAVDWVDTASPAVGEMVFRIGQALDLALDTDTANCLYLALVTDTGGFRYSNSTPAAFEAAAALVRAGAQPARVAQWLYESQPASAIRLLGEMLRSLELFAEGRVATVWLTEEMFQRAGAAPGDSEGLIDHPRSIGGVEAVALFRQLPSGAVKASLRSRGAVDVEAIARHRGGGGHHNAAGFTLEADDPREDPVIAQETRDALIKAVAGLGVSSGESK